MRAWTSHPAVRRLVVCLFGGFVLALMVGNQEGSQNDFGVSFHKATATGRLLAFLALGLIAFLVLSFWPAIRPYIRQPGAVGVVVGFVSAFVGMTLLRWYDPVGKFGPVSKAVSHSHGVPVLVSLYFSPVAWVLLALLLVLGGAAVASRRAMLGYVEAVAGVVAAIIVFVAHFQLVSFAGGIDHTLGVYFVAGGYVIFAASGVVVARSKVEVGDPRAAIDRALRWRPGLPMAAAGLILGLFAFLSAGWFAPLQRNDGFHKTGNDFHGYGLPTLVTAYLSWLAIALFVVSLVLAAVATLYRSRLFGVATLLVGLLGVVLTFTTLDKVSNTGARVAMQYGKTWQNLGAGGWLACMAFSLVAAAGAVAATATRGANTGDAFVSTQADSFASGTGRGSAVSATVIPVALAVVLFYPPTLPLNWQNVVVAQIAAYLLLAVGLNVVVGWAGLLDLGYIAFYGIGSYTTAYLTGSLPLKPPSYLHFTPLAAIPFAIVACLIAGVLLGAPTLRLRGDYLAIVTLGFGEIIQLAAINNIGGLTGGPIGPDVPHPTLDIGWLNLHITWGLDNLPYWYLLVVLLVIVLFFFYRLEGSRIGRAWAAIREDEVAAAATGIKTTRVKLLAFAIGASTSGLAGVFFASQIGYFDPTQFTVQNSILIVAYVVFGGMGSLQGAVAGAAVLTWLPYFLQSQVPLPDSQMWIGAIVIIMMIFRPAGLIPAQRRRAELRGLDTPVSTAVTAVPASEGL